MIENVMLFDIFCLVKKANEKTFWGFTFNGGRQIGVRAKNFEEAVKKAYAVEGVDQNSQALCTPFPARLEIPDSPFKEVQ